MYYLSAITILLCISYFVLAYLFTTFFPKDTTHLPRPPFFSLMIIIFTSIIAFWISFIIPDPALGNRFLHAIGGGFMGFLTCFLVVRDKAYTITQFQFLVFSFLLVTALGVANEILEYVLQIFFGFISNKSLYDTWLDLISNTIGILVAATCFVPFVNKKSTLK